MRETPCATEICSKNRTTLLVPRSLTRGIVCPTKTAEGSRLAKNTFNGSAPQACKQAASSLQVASQARRARSSMATPRESAPRGATRKLTELCATNKGGCGAAAHASNVVNVVTCEALRKLTRNEGDDDGDEGEANDNAERDKGSDEIPVVPWGNP